MSQPAALEDLLASRAVWQAGRQAPNLQTLPSGHPGLDALLPGGGFPLGALTELLIARDGVGELQLAWPLLRAQARASRPVALVAPPYQPYVPAWTAAGLDLRGVVVVEAADQAKALWAMEQCLRSGACSVVLGWPRTSNGQLLRRLQVAALGGQCIGLLFRDAREAVNPSPAALRLLHGADGWRVLKCRGSATPAGHYSPSRHGRGG